MQVIEQSKELISKVNLLVDVVARNPDIPLHTITDVLKSIDRLEKAISYTESKGE